MRIDGHVEVYVWAWKIGRNVCWGVVNGYVWPKMMCVCCLEGWEEER